MGGPGPQINLLDLQFILREDEPWLTSGYTPLVFPCYRFSISLPLSRRDTPDSMYGKRMLEMLAECQQSAITMFIEHLYRHIYELYCTVNIFDISSMCLIFPDHSMFLLNLVRMKCHRHIAIKV